MQETVTEPPNTAKEIGKRKESKNPSKESKKQNTIIKPTTVSNPTYNVFW